MATPASTPGGRALDASARVSARPAKWSKVRTLNWSAIPIVDFLKIDCEGYEVFVVEGEPGAIARCRPCVIVEQKEETGMVERYGVGPIDAVLALEAMGAIRRRVIQGDYILSFD